jgi:hypothetical protein
MANMISAELSNASLSSLSKAIAKAERDAQIAHNKVINKAAYNTYVWVTKDLVQAIDRPTPFTRKAVGYTKSTVRNPQAAVFIRRIQAEYLRLSIFSGGAINKVKPVPSKHRENTYGNLPRRATKAKRTFTIKAKGGGKDLIARRTGKGKSSKLEFIGAWSKRRVYRKQMDFYQTAKRYAERFLKQDR